MSSRTERVAKAIKEELGWMLERGELKDPRIGFVTITEVNVSPDLRHARVYFSVIGSKKKRADSTAGLASARGHIRTELGKKLQMKYTPEIDFHYDASAEAGSQIAKIIHQLRNGE